MLFCFSIYPKTKQEKIKLKNVTVNFERPEKWQLVQGMYGREISILGKPTSGIRPVISIDHAKVKSWSPDKELKLKDTYLNNKKSWIEKSRAEFISSYLGEKKSDLIKWPHLVNRIIYRLGKNKFESVDIMLKCPSDIVINVSYLNTISRLKNDQPTWSRFLRSFTCT